MVLGWKDLLTKQILQFSDYINRCTRIHQHDAVTPFVRSWRDRRSMWRNIYIQSSRGLKESGRNENTFSHANFSNQNPPRKSPKSSETKMANSSMLKMWCGWYQQPEPEKKKSTAIIATATTASNGKGIRPSAISQHFIIHSLNRVLIKPNWF